MLIVRWIIGGACYLVAAAATVVSLVMTGNLVGLYPPPGSADAATLLGTAAAIGAACVARLLGDWITGWDSLD